MSLLRRSWELRAEATIFADLKAVVDWYAAPERLEEHAAVLRSQAPEYMQTSTHVVNGLRVWECRWKIHGRLASSRTETLLGPHGVAIPTDDGYRIESEVIGQSMAAGDSQRPVAYRSVTDFREIASGAVLVSTRQFHRAASGWDQIVPPMAARMKLRRGVEGAARRCQAELGKARD